MQKGVLSIMNQEAVSEIAQNDPLIMMLGESWLRRNVANLEKRNYYASSRMRLAAKLLQHLNTLMKYKEMQDKNGDPELVEEPSTSESVLDKAMWDFLTPEHFEDVVLSSIKCTYPNADDMEDLRAPSNAIKLKYDIQRLVNTKWALLLKNG